MTHKKCLHALALLLCSSALFLQSCNSCNNKPGPKGDDDRLDKIAVNPDFELMPPIADDVFIKAIENDNENLLLIASIPEDQLKDKFLAIETGDGRVVLHDDGKDGDEQEGDRLFTVKMKRDEEELKMLSGLGTELERNKGRIEFWEGRELKVKKAKGTFALDAFKESKRVSIIDVLGFFPPPPNLKERSLMITDLRVVQDPTRTWNPCTKVGNDKGVWTFGELMRQLASERPGSIATDAQLSKFVVDWLQTWSTAQNVNADNIPARSAMLTRVLNNWWAASAASGMPNGQLNMKLAPFRLLAIVNRIDLRTNSGYGGGNAGEGRFVFCLVDQSNCAAKEFTVIFEYGVNIKGCTAVKSYGLEWYNLRNFEPGSADYNSKLEAITKKFTQCGSNVSKPNQSSLNQIRTNEIDLVLPNPPWELREFNLVNNSLKPTTVKQEPSVRHNAKVNNPDVVRLAKYVNDNTGIIEANKYTVPVDFAGVPFLGAKSHVPSPSTFWNGTEPAGTASAITSNKARHMFSLGTCAGCHARETSTVFTHVKPAAFNTEAPLSGFLTGIEVTDPAGRPAGAPDRRRFADLDRRASDLARLVRPINCISIVNLGGILTHQPIRMTH